MIEVDINCTVRTRVDRAMLARAARAALNGRVPRAQVSILVVGDALMRRMNRDTLGHDYTTDVLSFDHGLTPEGALIELVVCQPFATRQAASLGIPAAQELARYVVHGCLHCAGHDDRTPQLRKKMWAAQEQVMHKLLGRMYRPTL